MRCEIGLFCDLCHARALSLLAARSGLDGQIYYPLVSRPQEEFLSHLPTSSAMGLLEHATRAKVWPRHGTCGTAAAEHFHTQGLEEEVFCVRRNACSCARVGKVHRLPCPGMEFLFTPYSSLASHTLAAMPTRHFAQCSAGTALVPILAGWPVSSI